MLRYLATGLILASLHPHPAAAETCAWPSKPKPLNASRVLLWHLRDSSALESSALPLDEKYHSYRQWALRLPDMQTPQKRIENDLRAHMSNPGTLPAQKKSIRRNLSSILSGRVGSLRQINCLEALLVSEANRRRSLARAQYEFGAMVLSRKLASGESELKVYFTMGEQVSVSFDEILPRLTNDLQDGWTLRQNLHNHPFFRRDPHKVGGYTAPSLGDVAVYQSWKSQYDLQSAVVTNGVYSFEIDSAQFGQQAP